MAFLQLYTILFCVDIKVYTKVRTSLCSIAFNSLQVLGSRLPLLTRVPTLKCTRLIKVLLYIFRNTVDV